MNHIIKYNATRGRQHYVCFCGATCSEDEQKLSFMGRHARCGRFVEEKKWSNNN